VITGRNDSGERRDNFHGQVAGYGGQRDASQGQFCHLCGAWRGSLGLEPTPALYVAHLVEVFREVKRVLREDGVLWVVIGDSYATGGGRVGRCPGGGEQGERWGKRWSGVDDLTQPNRLPIPGLKPKDLCGIPWRVAFALQDDGWFLRSDIIWAKGISFCDTYSGSCMPESVRDRPTKGHEYVFLLSKSARYYYDQEAVREANASEPHSRGSGACAEFATTEQRHAGSDATNRE
jgi:hypothetical protein